MLRRLFLTYLSEVSLGVELSIFFLGYLISVCVSPPMFYVGVYFMGNPIGLQTDDFVVDTRCLLLVKCCDDTTLYRSASLKSSQYILLF